MSNISQIVASFLGLFAVILIGYVIYLYSASANVEQRIQEEGAKLATELEKSPVFNRSYLVNFSHVLMGFGKEYPGIGPLDFTLAFSDLIYKTLAGYEKPEKIDNLLKKYIPEIKDIKLGDVYIFTIQRLAAFMLHYDIMDWNTIEFSRRVDDYKRRDEMYPFGLSGVEEWISIHGRVGEKMSTLLAMRTKAINTLGRKIEKRDDGIHVTTSIRNQEVNSWLDSVEKWLSGLDSKVRMIKTLRLQKKDYSVSVRVSSITSIVVLLILSFILGVFAPVILDQLFEKIPSHITIPYWCVITGLLALVYGLFINDTLKYESNREIRISYLSPMISELKSNLRLSAGRPTMDTQDLARFHNRTLHSRKSEQLDDLARRSLESSSEYNRCSEEFTEKVIGVLKKRKHLRRDDLMKELNLITELSIFSVELFKKQIDDLKNQTDSTVQIGISSSRIGYSVIIATVPSIRIDEKRNDLLDEISKAIFEILDSQETKNCLKIRQKALNIQKELLDQIEKEVG